MLFKKFCAGLITELMNDLAGLFNSLSLNTSTFQLTDQLLGSSYIKLPVQKED